MIETEITILINRKTDIEIIKNKVIESDIEFPVYIFEFENHFQLNFVSSYEEWELDTEILDFFTEYEFTTNLENGKKEIRLQISRYQSEFSSDDWGRRIENPINETKYLIKKSNKKIEKFNPQVKVLFKNNEQNYYINIIEGINKNTGQNGFLLLKEFENHFKDDEIDFFNDKLYNSPIEAFNNGCYKIQEIVNRDFKEYLENKKKEKIELQKIPRKIIRDFINSCNKYEIEGIFKNLDESIIFEKKNNWKTEFFIEGIEEFEKYIKSPNQELCSRNFKIRSSWSIKLPYITIGLKYYPISIDKEKEINPIQRYVQFSFELMNNKITSLVIEN